jgi:hypothetical protein
MARGDARTFMARLDGEAPSAARRWATSLASRSSRRRRVRQGPRSRLDGEGDERAAAHQLHRSGGARRRRERGASVTAAGRALALAGLSALLAVLVAAHAGHAQDARVTLFLWHAYGEHRGTRPRGCGRRVRGARAGGRARRPRGGHSRCPSSAYASKLEAAIPVGNGPDVFVDAHERIASYVEEALVRDFGALDHRARRGLRARPPRRGPSPLRRAPLGRAPRGQEPRALREHRSSLRGRRSRSIEELEALRVPAPRGLVPARVYELDSSAYATRRDVPRLRQRGTSTTTGASRFETTEAAERARSHARARGGRGRAVRGARRRLVRSLFRSGHAVAAVSGPWLAPDLPTELHYDVRPLPRVETGDGRSGALVPFSTIESVFLASHDSEAGSGPVEERHRAAERARALPRGARGSSRLRARAGRPAGGGTRAGLGAGPRLASEAAPPRRFVTRRRGRATDADAPHMRAAWEPGAHARWQGPCAATGACATALSRARGASRT